MYKKTIKYYCSRAADELTPLPPGFVIAVELELGTTERAGPLYCEGEYDRAPCSENLFCR